MKLGKIILAASLCFGVVNAGDFVDYKKLTHNLKGDAKKNGEIASTDEVKKALASADWAVVDVRTMDEWQAASIAGSVRIGREAPEKALEGIVLDDNNKFVKQNIVVVCNTASRAAIEAQAFRQMGFNTVKIYGIETWMQECNPVNNWYSNVVANKDTKAKFGSVLPAYCAK
ncbi:MAG: rhodanese-like domain-containing protein [Arcobacteraceae bacterium]|nr:rhodanese-like domain-containing protein [Arcobacteraceae bacterium]